MKWKLWMMTRMRCADGRNTVTIHMFYYRGIPEGNHTGVAVYGVYYWVHCVYYGVSGGGLWVF